MQSIPVQIPYLRVKSSLYRPELKPEDLSADPLRRRSQIRHESLKVQEKMNQMLSELDRLGTRPQPSEQVENLNEDQQKVEQQPTQESNNGSQSAGQPQS
jgi:hypothetical protein